MKGEQNAQKYTGLARSALCTGNYDLYALDNSMSLDEIAVDGEVLAPLKNVCGLLLLLERKALKEKQKVDAGF